MRRANRILFLAIFASVFSLVNNGEAQLSSSGGDGQPSLAQLQNDATEGKADAQYQLGSIYYNGQGVETNYTEAVKWFTAAADQGQLQAENKLANCYYCGDGVDKDWNKAAALWRKAADAGDLKSQYDVGLNYQNGEGVTQDDTEAIKWFQKAADRGYADAEYMMGHCYGTGKGVDQDRAQAAQWYLKAASQGNVDAEYQLGVYYSEGLGVQQDDHESFKWYMKAAQQGDADSEEQVALCYEKGSGVEGDKAKALEWFRKAAQAGKELSRQRVQDYEAGNSSQSVAGTDSNIESTNSPDQSTADTGSNSGSSTSLTLLTSKGIGQQTGATTADAGAQSNPDNSTNDQSMAQNGGTSDADMEKIRASLAAIDDTPKIEFSNAVQQVNEKLAQKDYDGAEKTIDGYLKDFPDAREALAVRVEIQLQGGHAEKAVRELNQLLVKYPEDGGILLLRSTAELYVNDPVGALEDVDEAMSTTPTPIKLSLLYSTWSIVKTNNADTKGAKADYWIARKLLDEPSAQEQDYLKLRAGILADLDKLGAQLKIDSSDRTSSSAIDDILADRLPLKFLAYAGDMFNADTNVDRLDYDAKTALAFYRKAAYSGDARGQCIIAECYAHYYHLDAPTALMINNPLQEDVDEALKWYRRAANQGDIIAQFRLGADLAAGSLEDMTEIPKDVVEGYKWLKIAASNPGSNNDPEDTKTFRDAAKNSLPADMTADQIAEGNRRAAAFVPQIEGQSQ